MQYIFQAIIIVLFIGCSPKIATKTKTDFQKIKPELQSVENDYSMLGNKFSDFQIVERTLIKGEAKSKREISTIQLKSNH